MPAVLEHQVQSASVDPKSPQPPAAVDNVDVLALAAMFSARPPKSEPVGASSAASANPDPAASQPEAEPVASEPAGEAPVSETPPAQSPNASGAEDGSPPTEAESPAAEDPEGGAPRDPKAVREFEYPKFQSRVDQLTAKVRELEGKLAATGATQAPVAPPVATPREPSEAALTLPVPADAGLQDLESRIEQAGQMIELAAQNPDGFSHTGKDGQPIEFNGEQLRRMAAKATADMASLTAQREVRVSHLQAARQQRVAAGYEQAAQRYPWLKDPASEHYQAAMALVKEVPALLARDDVALIVAGAIEARHLAKAGKPASKPVPAVKPTVMTTRPAGTPTRTAGGTLDRQIEEAEQVAERTGSIHDLARTLALKAQRRAVAAGAR